jgi:isopentenyldiphosphate isomerase
MNERYILRQEVITLVFYFMEALAIVHPVTNTPMGTLPRAQAIQEGAWCRSTNVFVMNSKGEILCHQRSLGKERMPGVWSTHLGGHVGGDESYESNAQKELTEESGIVVDANALIPWRTTKLEKAHLCVKEFVVHVDKDISELIPQPGEVECFAWMSPEDILKAAGTDDKNWCAGTHNFMVEYHCLRAALTASRVQAHLSTGVDLHTWHPLEPQS